jgi:nicotinamide riboside transporter PnuC
VKLRLDAETCGALTGIAGALLVASMSQYSRFGWLLFLCSNVCWIVFAVQGKFHKLLLQQFAYTGTSLLGIWNSFIPGAALAAYIHQLLLRFTP